MANAPDDTPIIRAGMTATLARWRMLYVEHQDNARIRDAANARMAELAARIADCRAACRAFGFDTADNEIMKEAVARYGDEAHLLVDQREVSTEEAPASLGTSVPASELTTKPATPRVKDMILDRLRGAGSIGSKAKPIRDYIQSAYSTDLHEKTVGMTLYRLLKEGLVRREGHTWFIVPPTAETVNPGAGTPGSETASTAGKE